MILTREPCMTLAQASSAGTKRVWWLLDLDAGDDGSFVKLGWHPATDALSVDVPPSRYLIGAGGPEHYREEIDLAIGGQRAPCITAGCSGSLTFDPWGPPPRCEPDRSPRDRMCTACRNKS